MWTVKATWPVNVFSCDSKNMLISASDGLSVVSHIEEISVSFLWFWKGNGHPFHTCVVFWWRAPILASWMKSRLSPLWVQKIWRQTLATMECETNHYIIHMGFFPGSITSFYLSLFTCPSPFLYPWKIPPLIATALWHWSVGWLCRPHTCV